MSNSRSKTTSRASLFFGLGEVKIAPGAKQGDGGGAEGWVEKAEVVLA